jgi:hypothetical protein
MRVEPSLLIPAGFERAPRPQRGTGREEADPSTNRENPRDGKAGRFYILNTNCKNGTTDHEDMIQNRKAAAYFDPWKRKIEQLGKGDTVLLYQNGVGIVAMGRASGKLEKAAYHGDAKHKDEEYFMGLEPFEHVDPPLSAAKVKDLTGKDFRFLQTMFSVDSDSAAAIVGYIQNQRSL